MGNYYDGVRRIVYGECGATFVPVCERCHRFVMPDESVWVSEDSGLEDAPNATCRKCGRVQMLFEGFV